MGRGLDDQDLRSQDVNASRDRDSRETHGRSVERPNPRAEVRELSETRDEQDREFDDERTHHLQLPCGATREPVLDRDREYRLRGSEVDVLETIGQYRAVFVDDLVRETSDPARLATDLRSLKDQELIEVRTISRFSPEESADVVSLTEAGQRLLNDHRDPDEDAGQQYYSGWVKPAELWHDAGLFRMVRDVELEVEHDGGEVLRVVLDDELKSEAFKRLYDVREERGLSDDAAHRDVANALRLHVEDGHFVLPDVRLEIRDAEGEVRTVDLELVTKDYRSGQLSGKSNAGFRMFRAGSGSRRGGTPTDPARYLE